MNWFYSRLPLFVVTLFLTVNTANAWQHSVYVGYGWGNEIERSYGTQALVLGGKLYKFRKINDTLIATIDAAFSQLEADTPTNRNLTTLSAALGLRAYFMTPDVRQVTPYLGISSGPAWLSSRYFGEKDQGANVDLRTTLEGGVEFALQKGRAIDVNLQLMHYCNAGLVSPNQGFNIPFMLSIGYQF